MDIESSTATKANQPLSLRRHPGAVIALTWGLVVLIFVVALGVRLASWQTAYGHAIRADELDYVIPAETFTRTGQYFDTFQTHGRTWTRVPLNALVLAAAFATQPPVPPEATVADTGLMTARFAAGNLLLSAVSLALLPLVMALATEAFLTRRRRAALLAGAITAVYPPLVNSAAQQLLSETLFITLMFAALWTLTRWQPLRRAWPWLVATGGLLGLAALARPVAVAFVPFAGLWIWLTVRGQSAATHPPPRTAGLRQAFIGTVIVTAALLLAISPWTWYNYRAYGRLLLLDTANVTAFWHYNNFSGENENVRLEALPNPADRQALIVREGFANIMARPDRFTQNVLFSLGYAWHLELQSALLPNAWDLTRRDADVPDVLPTDIAFLLVSLTGLAGMVGLGGRRAQDQAGRVRSVVLWWVVSTLALGAIIPYDARYRMPATPGLIIFAAGLLALADWRRVADPRSWGAALRGHPWIAGVTALLAAWVIVGAAGPSIPPAIQALTLNWQAEQTHDPAQAAALHTAAIAALPDSFWPYRQAAVAARGAGQDADARRLYGEAMRLGEDPRSVLGLAALVYGHPEWTLTADERRQLQTDPNELRGAPWNSFRPPPVERLTVGQVGDLAYLQGFQPAERDGATPFRWSGGQSDLRLPAIPDAAPATAIRLRLAAPPLGPPTSWPVTIQVDGAAPVTLQVGAGWAEYEVPLSPPLSGDLRLHLSSPVRSPHTLDPASPDQRLLGVGVQWVARVAAP
jgi:hypothetical protein